MGHKIQPPMSLLAKVSSLHWSIKSVYLLCIVFIGQLFCQAPDEFILSSVLGIILHDHKIIPDVLSFTPVTSMRVAWPNGSSLLGNTLNIPTTRFEPTFIDWKAEHPDDFHTLMFVGPDEPNPKKPYMREYQHWLVGNIPGKNVSAGKVMTEYIHPVTPIAHGAQRYVFLVYRQPRGFIYFEEPFLPDVPNDVVRANFSCRKFAEKYGFGVPLGVNFFYIDWGAFN